MTIVAIEDIDIAIDLDMMHSAITVKTIGNMNSIDIIQIKGTIAEAETSIR